MQKHGIGVHRVHRLNWLVATLLILLGSLFLNVYGDVYMSLFMEPFSTITMPPVVLQNGTAGTSTIYTNNTSAKTSVEAPLFDYVDNNDPDMDSSADKGTHSNFTAQQAGPDSIYDSLAEENIEAIEDYVDNISDVDSSPDIGTHSSFDNMKSRDDTYDTLNETDLAANEYSIDLTGGHVMVSTADITTAQGTISFWIQFDDVATGRPVGANGDLEIRLDTGNVIDFDWGGDNLMTSSNTFTTFTWYFFVITWDENADDLFFYVGTETSAPTQDSNSQDGTYTGTVSTIPQGTVYWGNGYGAAQPVNGHMDDIRFYNTVRTLSEILTDYNQTLNGNETGLVNYYKLENDYTDSTGTDDGSLSGSGAFDTDVPSWEGGDNYDLDLEVQFTNVIDFLPTEKLCIYTGTLSDEDLRVDYWNGTGWENLATDLTAYSCNEYTVSLTSANFTIRFKGGTTGGDTTKDQWQVDATLLRLEGAGSKEDAVDQQTNVDGQADVGTHSNFTAQQYGPDSINDTLTEVEVSVSDNNNVDSEIVTYGSTTGISGAQTIDGITENVTEGAIAGATPVLASYEVNEGNDVTSISVNKPTGTSSGDLLIILLGTDGTTPQPSTPTGFTYITTWYATDGHIQCSWYREADGTEGASFSSDWSGGNAEEAVMACLRITGWDNGDFPHKIATNSATSGDPVFPAVTTEKDNCLLLRWYGMDEDDDTEPIGGVPSGHDVIFARETDGTSGQTTLAACNRTWATAGGTGTATWNQAATTEGWNTFTLAIAPPVVGYQLDVEHVTSSIAHYENYNLTVRAYRSAESFYLQLYNFSSSQWVNMSTISASSLTWYNTTFAKADFVNSTNQARIRCWQGEDASQNILYVDYSGVYGWNATYYKLDLEGHWTDLHYSLPNEELCIYAGSLGAEDIKVDVWNGSAWVNVISDLNASTWNNVTITSYLTSGNFTIRFKCGNEAGDTSPDTWDVDVALIRVWHDGGESYEVDLEVQWTTAYYTRTNEELCIRTGTFSGSEDIQVKVWNSTGSSWHWVMNLTASQWNNVSITSYLKSSTFTVQFLGGTETGDTTQDSWNIDTTLLRVWNSESTDYVDYDTSNVDSSADKGTHSNFTAQQYGPDLINDTLTESEDGGGTVWLWQEDTSGYSSTSSYETFQFWNSWTTNSTTSGTVTKIGIYVFADPGNSPQVKLGIYEDNSTNPGSPGNLLGETNATTITGAGWLDLEIDGGGVSISASTTYHVAHITDIVPTTQWRHYKAATPVSDYRGSRVWDNLFDPAGATTKSGSYRYGAYRVGYDESSGYRLDLEVQWTTDYTTYEELCIKTGAFNGSEDVMVYAWNVSAPDWHFLYNLTASSWNNVSVTDWFFNENFTVRFLGGSENSDTTRDGWNIDASLLHVSTSNGTYDYVLRVNNTETDSWQIRLKKYADSNTNRLQNCTIYFHNSSDGTSRQIYIQNGAYINQTGPWYDLGDSETIYIAMTVEANGTGTSTIYAYLEILIPNTTTYFQCVLTFEIT